jgi:hypothetical protein
MVPSKAELRARVNFRSEFVFSACKAADARPLDGFVAVSVTKLGSHKAWLSQTLTDTKPWLPQRRPAY